MIRLSILMVALLFCSAIHAQSIKLSTGISQSDLKWNYPQGTGLVTDQNEVTKSNYSTFFFISYLNKVNDHIDWQGSIGFINKGSNGIFVHIEDSDLSYLSFELLAYYHPFEYKLNPYVMIGPKGEVVVDNSDNLDIYDEMAEMSNISYGIRYGTGFTYNVNSQLQTFAELAGDFQFNDIITNDGESIRPVFEIREKLLMVRFGVIFQIGS